MPRSQPGPEPRDAGEWLHGGGEMGDLVRAFDWSATPLGPRREWPQPLRTAVDMVLSSGFPMAILWSADLIFIYNDGYRPIAGGKHPRALGRSTREIWQEVWDFNRPIFEKVMSGGETVVLEDQHFPITRNGDPEDAYFTLSYSPIRVEDGSVGGTLVTLVETTKLVVEERRLRRASEMSRAELEATIHSIQDEVWIVDPSGRVILVNDAVTRNLGVSPGHWADIHTAIAELEIFNPEGLPRPAERAPLTRALGGEVLTNELELVRNLTTGELRWREVTGAPMYGPDGAITGAVVIARDITERKRAEAELQHLAQQRQLALDAARLGWWHYDPVTWSGTYDARYREIFGVSASQLTIEEIISRLHPDDRPMVRARVDTALDPTDPRPYSAEYRVLREDGTECWVEAHGQAIFTGEGDDRRAVSFVGTVQDVTARRQMEDSLRRAKEDAEAASRAKDRLLAVVSHELRTPLSPILTIASYLLERGDFPRELREDVEMIRRNVRQEARLVDDLLSLTRLSRGKIILHQEVVNLHGLIRTVIGQFQAQMDEKRIELLVALRAGPHLVWADPGRMQQVLSNLLDNAVKFTPAGGRITVRSSTTPAGQVRVEIADTGIGIAPELVPELFNPFQQGEGTVTRQFGGLGLGLVIAKGIVDLHGGTITASSEGPGRGAVFTLEIAAMPEAEAGRAATPAARTPETPAAAAAHRRRILLVDDHVDTLESMSRLLRLGGYEVLTASSVRDAIAKIESEDFDLLVSDIGLPDGSGLDIMRHMSRVKGKPGIALSGFGHDDDVRHSREAGFSRHMVKPVNFQTLNKALSELAN